MSRSPYRPGKTSLEAELQKMEAKDPELARTAQNMQSMSAYLAARGTGGRVHELPCKIPNCYWHDPNWKPPAEEGPGELAP